MQRIDVYLDEKWIAFLKELPGNLSEHIRQAVNNYISDIESKKVSASVSKGGGKDE